MVLHNSYSKKTHGFIYFCKIYPLLPQNSRSYRFQSMLAFLLWTCVAQYIMVEAFCEGPM
jgi:hypothetical protein